MEQMVLGGVSAVEKADEEIQQICDKIRPLVEAKLMTVFPEFKAVEHTQQTVRGMMRRIKVHVGDLAFLNITVLDDLSKALVLKGVDPVPKVELMEQQSLKVDL